MQEFFYELRVKPKGRFDFFSSLAMDLFEDAIELKDDEFILRSEESLEDIRWALESAAKKIGVEIEFSLEKKKNEDWIKKYQDSIKPIQISSFYIRPQWEEEKKNLTNIIINPALAFGSGHHQSTSSCILLLDKVVKKDHLVLDVGCGSGILGICAAKKGAKVDICDTDEVAINSAKENFLLNKVDFDRAWVGSSGEAKNRYDVVFANIIADVILMISNDLKKAVKESGYLILSGIIDKYLDKVKEKFSDFLLQEHIKKDEWNTLLLKKG